MQQLLLRSLTGVLSLLLALGPAAPRCAAAARGAAPGVSASPLPKAAAPGALVPSDILQGAASIPRAAVAPAALAASAIAAPAPAAPTPALAAKPLALGGPEIDFDRSGRRLALERAAGPAPAPALDPAARSSSRRLDRSTGGPERRAGSTVAAVDALAPARPATPSRARRLAAAALRRVFLALALASSLVLGACGDGYSSSPSASESVEPGAVVLDRDFTGSFTPPAGSVTHEIYLPPSSVRRTIKAHVDGLANARISVSIESPGGSTLDDSGIGFWWSSADAEATIDADDYGSYRLVIDYETEADYDPDSLFDQYELEVTVKNAP